MGSKEDEAAMQHQIDCAKIAWLITEFEKTFDYALLTKAKQIAVRHNGFFKDFRRVSDCVADAYEYLGVGRD